MPISPRLYELRRNRFDRFLVISGDALTDIDLTDMVRFHRENGAMVTIGLKRVANPLEFGIIIVDDDGKVQRFLEKPTWGQVFSDTVNTGVYVLEPEIFELIPADRPVDFSEEVFPAALERGLLLQGVVVDGYWEDVGTIEAYFAAELLLSGRLVPVSLMPDWVQIRAHAPATAPGRAGGVGQAGSGRRGGQPLFRRPGAGSRSFSPCHARFTRWAATTFRFGFRTSSHHWPVSAHMPTRACAYMGASPGS